MTLISPTRTCARTTGRLQRDSAINRGSALELSLGVDEMVGLRSRIAQLEAGLALTRDACVLFDAEAVVPQKRRRAIVEGLIARGHSARAALPNNGISPI